MDFKTFLYEYSDNTPDRGWIVNGKFVDVDVINQSHPEYAHRQGYEGPEDLLEKGGVRILWYNIGQNKYSVAYEWVKNALKPKTKQELLTRIQKDINKGYQVELEVHFPPSWESDFQRFTLENEKEMKRFLNKYT